MTNRKPRPYCRGWAWSNYGILQGVESTRSAAIVAARQTRERKGRGVMDFTREWTAFALEAEYEDFGPGRIVKAHNARLAGLTRELEDARQAERAQAQAARRYRSALLDLRIQLHAAGRRPEECYEMSIIDAALVAEKGEQT